MRNTAGLPEPCTPAALPQVSTGSRGEVCHCCRGVQLQGETNGLCHSALHIRQLWHVSMKGLHDSGPQLGKAAQATWLHPKAAQYLSLKHGVLIPLQRLPLLRSWELRRLTAAGASQHCLCIGG